MSGGGFGSRFSGTTPAKPTGPKGGGFGGRFKATSAAAPSQHHGHGFLHILGQGVEDIKNAAVNLPGGIYNSGKAVGSDLANFYAHPGSSKRPFQHTAKLVGQVAHATAHDFEHPLRHPGNTLLDTLAALSLGAGSVSRVAEVGRVARAGEVGDIGRAALKGPKPEARFAVSPSTGEKVPAGTYARAASTRAVQKGLDKLRLRYPNLHIGFRNQYQRVGHAADTNARFEEDLRRAPANQLVGAGKRLRQPQKLALRVVAEEVPLAQRLEHAKLMLKDETRPAYQKALRNHIKLLNQSGEFVHDVNGVPRLKPDQERLIHVYEKAKTLANKTEQSLTESGQLTEKGAASRKAMVGEVIRGDIHSKAGFNPDLTPDLFSNRDGFYVTYKHQPVPHSIERPARLGSPQGIGIPRKPSQLTHPFEGASLRQGEVNPETPQLVAQHYLQVSRFLNVWERRHQLESLAKDHPSSGGHDIPIRPIWMKTGWPAEVRGYMHDLNRPLQPDEQKNLAQRFHEAIFPKHVTQDEINSGGVKWVDKRELGNLNRPGPLAGTSANPGFAKVLRGVDAINQAEKTATIYLRLGHILTRGANNFVFNLVQQGFLAPKNLARAARISTTLGDDAATRLDAIMGEGYMRSLGDFGPGHVLTGKIQRFYEKRVDLPFRRASFIHEAIREGYRSNAQITKLLTDEADHDALLRVAQRASNEIIDYARLGPVERDFIRRIVFIYPWMKGATMYGGRFLGEHPLQAGAYGQIGRQQEQRTHSELGALPSYLEGIFKVGGGTNTPTIVNPRVINQFGTPADVLEAAKGVITGNPKKAYKLAQFLMPAYQAAMGTNDSAKAPKGLKGFLEGLYNSTPEYTLGERLAHPPAKAAKPRIYPYDRREALLQFFGGSVSPHKLNRARANAAAYKEAHPRP